MYKKKKQHVLLHTKPYSLNTLRPGSLKCRNSTLRRTGPIPWYIYFVGVGEGTQGFLYLAYWSPPCLDFECPRVGEWVTLSGVAARSPHVFGAWGMFTHYLYDFFSMQSLSCYSLNILHHNYSKITLETVDNF